MASLGYVGIQQVTGGQWLPSLTVRAGYRRTQHDTWATVTKTGILSPNRDRNRNVGRGDFRLSQPGKTPPAFPAGGGPTKGTPRLRGHIYGSLMRCLCLRKKRICEITPPFLASRRHARRFSAKRGDDRNDLYDRTDQWPTKFWVRWHRLALASPPAFAFRDPPQSGSPGP
jgi:hypothetical protein